MHTLKALKRFWELKDKSAACLSRIILITAQTESVGQALQHPERREVVQRCAVVELCRPSSRPGTLSPSASSARAAPAVEDVFSCLIEELATS